MYENGIGVAVNRLRALNWYAMAAESGHRAAIDQHRILLAQAPPEPVPPPLPTPEPAPVVNPALPPDPVPVPPPEPAPAPEPVVAEKPAGPPAQDVAVLAPPLAVPGPVGSPEPEPQTPLPPPPGAGIPPDPPQAYLWWTLASGQGHLEATQFLTKLRAEMTDDDLSRAVELLEMWVERR